MQLQFCNVAFLIAAYYQVFSISYLPGGAEEIWNNEQHDDVGFEKMLRLFLVSIEIIFPGLHVRTLFGRFGRIGRNRAVEFFVLFKTLLPLFFLTSGLYRYPLAI
jgi:hypothetical protein